MCQGARQRQSPFIPHLVVCNAAPHHHLNVRTRWHINRLLDWDIHGEPAVHAWRVALRVDAQVDVPIQLGSEVACQAVAQSPTLQVGLEGQAAAAAVVCRLVRIGVGEGEGWLSRCQGRETVQVRHKGGLQVLQVVVSLQQFISVLKMFTWCQQSAGASFKCSGHNDLENLENLYVSHLQLVFCVQHVLLHNL